MPEPDPPPQDVLASWFDGNRVTMVRSVVAPSSFSGASLWQVQCDGGSYCLRLWPSRGPDMRRLRELHRFQRHLATEGPPV
ncbi:MAG: hypothetical protein AAF961_15150, partial [Planctomycetota bacterium]